MVAIIKEGKRNNKKSSKSVVLRKEKGGEGIQAWQICSMKEAKKYIRCEYQS